MAEWTLKERLQPSLLDRLIDDDPHGEQESRDSRVLSVNRLREVVRRDLGWLLNTVNLEAVEDLQDYPEAAGSVLNYGIPELTGIPSSGLDPIVLEKLVRQAVWDFEPRILRHTVKVTTNLDPESMSHNALTFTISGELWAQPMPIQLYLKSEIDLEIGQVHVTNQTGGESFAAMP